MRHIASLGRLNYVVHGPDPHPGAPTPVLVFLHGYDEGAPMPLVSGVTRHGPLRPGGRVDPTGTFLVIAPQLPTRGDLWHRYAADVRAIVESEQQTRAGDTERTYLSGFSFGGNGVFDLALAHAGFWAAAWAVDPTRVPKDRLNCPIWLSFGEASRYAAPLFVRTLALAPLGEGLFEADRVYLDEGADHVGAATLAFQDERIYRWLLSKRRPRA